MGGQPTYLGTGNNGNVFQITNNLNNDRTQIFTYDELNRVATAKTQATTGTYCWGHTFGYDIWANLTSRGVFTGYNGCTGEGSVPAATVKNQMAGHTYDAAGNYWPTGYNYDAENRLISAPGSMEFDYDGTGRRVRKSSGSNGTLYWYGAGGEVLQETNLSGVLLREFVYFNGKRTARRDSGGAVHYYFSNHLGSSSIVTDALGSMTACPSPSGPLSGEDESDYYPFGGERIVCDRLADQNYKFTGKERDFETNLDYFGARYYAYNFGRFITPDEFTGGPVDAFSSSDPLPPGPLPYADITNPQSLNKYTYVYNNPLRYTDPDGHCAAAPPFDTAACGFAVGGPPGAAVAFVGALLIIGGGAAIAYFASSDDDSGSNENVPPPPPTNTQTPEKEKTPAPPPPQPKPDEKTDRTGGGKDARKANPDRTASSKAREQELQREYDSLSKKPNKTPEDKARLDQLKRQIKRERERQKKSETHGRTGKKGGHK